MKKQYIANNTTRRTKITAVLTEKIIKITEQVFHSSSKVTFVVNSVEISKKLGLFSGLLCQQAFIILATTGGMLRGMGSL